MPLHPLPNINKSFAPLQKLVLICRCLSSGYPGFVREEDVFYFRACLLWEYSFLEMDFGYRHGTGQPMNSLIQEVRGNPRKRRNRLHIIAQILTVARGGALKTQIMYRASLSFEQLTAYLSLLVKFWLLEAIEKNEKLIYKTTAKGIRYLKSYEEIKHLLRESSEHSVASLGLPVSSQKRASP
jgi:predicted transcriptional regulator